jgi:Tol biopolymer transport system component
VLAGTVAAALPAGARVHDAFVNVDVFSVTLAGKTRAVAASPTLDSKPAVAPNGKTVAFVSARGGKPDIYLMNPAGGNVRRLTTSPFTPPGGGTAQMVNWGDFDAGETSIAWAPGSKRLVFTAVNATIDPSCFAHCYQGSVFVINVDGTGLRQIDSGAQSPVWSPNGKLIGYEGDMSPYGDVGAYYVARANGSGKVKLPAANGDPSPPSFSPDSKRIAFQTYRHDTLPAEIDIANVDGTHRHKLTIGYEPAWSPLGLIAYVRGRRIHAIHPDGSSDRILTRVNETASSPAWSPIARRVAFVSRANKANRCQIGVVDLPSGLERRLTHEPARSSPDAGPVWAPAGGTIYFARSLPPSGGCG